MSQIPSSALVRTRAVDSVAAYLRLLRDLPETRIGIIGNGLGTAAVSDRVKFFYVRLGDANGDVCEARSLSLLNPANDDVVLVRRERPGGLGSWVIIDWLGQGAVPLDYCMECNDCSGMPALKSVFVFDDNPARTQLAFYVEPCTPFVHVVAGEYNDVHKEGRPELDHTSTSYSINVANDDAPSVYYQSDFRANSLSDMWLLWVGTNTPNPPTAGGFLSEPLSIDFSIADGDTIDSFEASIRSAGVADHRLTVLESLTSGIAGRALYGTTPTPRWIDGFNVGGDTELTAQPVAVVDFVNNGEVGSGIVGAYGFLVLASLSVIPVSGYAEYDSSAPYTMFHVDGGFFWGTDEDGALDIVDVTDPTTPTLVSRTAGICAVGECLKRAGDYVWIGDSGTDDLIGVDVSNPLTPTIISTTALGDTPKGLEVCGDFVYVSLLGGAVVCYDVSTPAAPALNVTVTISDFTPYQKMLQIGFNHVYVLGVQTSTGKPTLGVLTA